MSNKLLSGNIFIQLISYILFVIDLTALSLVKLWQIDRGG